MEPVAAGTEVPRVLEAVGGLVADYLAGAEQIEVYQAGSGSPLLASVVALDTLTDVAVLRGRPGREVARAGG
jgi:hypothetical protein